MSGFAHQIEDLKEGTAGKMFGLKGNIAKAGGCFYLLTVCSFLSYLLLAGVLC